jgi:hypothetical protein
MKNYLLGLIATVMISVSGFANNNKTGELIISTKSMLSIDLFQSRITESRQITVINFEDSKTKTIVGCVQCGPQGCCILTVIKDDGTVRSTETCCKNIIVVKKPSLTIEEF